MNDEIAARNRGAFPILLLAALLVILCGSCGRNLSETWKPEWKVGDWWVMKRRSSRASILLVRDTSPDAIWRLQPGRILFKVTGIESVSGVRCYAVLIRPLPVPSRPPWGSYTYYFRCDNLRVARMMTVAASPRMGSHVDTTLQEFGTDNPVPFGGHLSWLETVPSFPLRLTGAEAESLKKARSYPGVGVVSQAVTTVRVKDFANALRTLDSVRAVNAKCYRVYFQHYANPMSDSIYPTFASNELWAPGLPWLLYAETPGPPGQPENPLAQRWLADYSRWHRKGARPDTVGR